jgi:glycosyltransferase involved in cell wall biosynthesis
MTVKLSVVVIGRNEGKRLSACLQSVKEMNLENVSSECIYVDSASTDDSVIRAVALGASIIHNPAATSNAAAARNLGWKAAKGEIILFLDGDTLLQPDFVKRALPFFEDPSMGVVCGHRREIFPKASIYQYVLDRDWVYPTGEVDACGGDALIRRKALEEVNGYDDELLAGEEPDMCKRMRALHYRIYRIDTLMTLHDLHIHTFRSYWIRCLRTGYAYASVSHRRPFDKNPLWKQESQHNLMKGGAFFLGLILLPWTWLPFFLWFIATCGLICVSAFKTKSWSYALYAHFQHIPMFIGQIAYWLDRMRFRKRSLIEYK